MWYLLTRNLQICPYCNNAVKPSSIVYWGLLAFFPALIAFGAQLYFGSAEFNANEYKFSLYGFALGGFALSFIFLQYEKDESL